MWLMCATRPCLREMQPIQLTQEVKITCLQKLNVSVSQINFKMVSA